MGTKLKQTLKFTNIATCLLIPLQYPWILFESAYALKIMMGKMFHSVIKQVRIYSKELSRERDETSQLLLLDGTMRKQTQTA